MQASRTMSRPRVVRRCEAGPMKPNLGSAARTRLALVAFASVWLSACGGGGGDTVAAAPSPVAAGSGSPTTAPPPAAAPAAFQAWGPLVVDTAVASDSSTSVARLGSGASVVAWVKGAALQAQRFDPSGARVGTPLRIVESGLANARAFAIAPWPTGSGSPRGPARPCRPRPARRSFSSGSPPRARPSEARSRPVRCMRRSTRPPLHEPPPTAGS